MCRYGIIYIYIYRERERDVYTYMYMCVYIYIYIHIERERERDYTMFIPGGPRLVFPDLQVRVRSAVSPTRVRREL